MKHSATLSNLFKRKRGKHAIREEGVDRRVDPVDPVDPAGSTDHVNQEPVAAETETGVLLPAANVAFTQRAWTAILAEVLKEISTETGGILIGYRNGSEWLVVESIDPGPNSLFQVAHFIYDQPYVTHLVNRVRNYYEPPLELLGLWHRHPGSFDQFSSTDDETNYSFASMSPAGAISGLVNIDPSLRLTLYRVVVDHNNSIEYTHIPFSRLNAEESAHHAPLRNADDLVSTIENWHPTRWLSSQSSYALPPFAEIDPLTVKNRIGATVERRKDESLAQALPPGTRVAWSDENLDTALEALSSDIAALGAHGVELRMKLIDEYAIGLSARRGEHEEPVCALVLVAPPAGSEIALCILHETEPSIPLPYEPGFFWQCITEKQQGETA